MGIAVVLFAGTLFGVVTPEVAEASGRRVEMDHIGAYNFMVEISGVNAGYFKGARFVQAAGLPETVQPAGKGDYVLRRTKRKKGQPVELVALLEKDTPAVRKTMQELKGRADVTVSVDLVNLKKTRLHGAGTVCGWRMVKTAITDVRFEQLEEGKAIAVLEFAPKRVQSACRQLSS